MKLHIIGICGTFMGSLARLAREMDIQVTGSDANTYPPMSTQLETMDVELFNGFDTENISADIDLILVGNSISRGNPELEYVLEKGLKFTSGAQWLHDHVLPERWVLAVAGTHGKTTTASLLTWILEDNGLFPGFLIGGVPENFGISSRLGESPFFVIEADEYDTAFSDKRSKFVHYQPRTVVLNNLEFDHADIFRDLEDIQRQFHHLLKIIPQSGKVLYNQSSKALREVIEQGCWSELSSFAEQNSDWQCKKLNSEASKFQITHQGQTYTAKWDLIGDYNMHNALAAIAAAHHVGVTIDHAIESLGSFKSVKRRLELIYNDNDICIYDDFAHHPTAIEGTVNALRDKVGDAKIIAILEPRSNTMKQGIHKDQIANALSAADHTFIYADQAITWDVHALASDNVTVLHDTRAIINEVVQLTESGDHILIMSNGGFDNLHNRLIKQLH